MVARDSEAALFGAHTMERQATTDGERAAAERALELARDNLVARPLVASLSGRVSALSTAAGSHVTADQELLTLTAADSLIFRAEVAQSDLGAVRPGEDATVEVAGGAAPFPARVRGLLAPDAGAAAGDLTAPVRIDFTGSDVPPAEGLYGTAHVVVATHRDVPVVPLAALLVDDVAGTRRIATVGDGGNLHWVEVETGLEDAERVEIVTPRLDPGTRVVVSGQVGLEEGTPLAIQP